MNSFHSRNFKHRNNFSFDFRTKSPNLTAREKTLVGRKKSIFFHPTIFINFSSDQAIPFLRPYRQNGTQALLIKKPSEVTPPYLACYDNYAIIH